MIQRAGAPDIVMRHSCGIFGGAVGVVPVVLLVVSIVGHRAKTFKGAPARAACRRLGTGDRPEGKGAHRGRGGLSRFVQAKAASCITVPSFALRCRLLHYSVYTSQIIASTCRANDARREGLGGARGARRKENRLLSGGEKFGRCSKLLAPGGGLLYTISG